MWIDACSVCGRLYRSEKSHEYLVNGASEETESHDPVTVDEVLAMSELRWSRLPGALLRELGDGAWAVIGEPARQWPIRRAGELCSRWDGENAGCGRGAERSSLSLPRRRVGVRGEPERVIREPAKRYAIRRAT